jgi:signal transduction histidine kinase
VSTGDWDLAEMPIDTGTAGALLPARLRLGALSTRLSWRTAATAVALVVGVGSVAIAAFSGRHWGFHDESTRVAVSTAAGIGALAVAWLVRVRYVHTHSAMAWLLMTGLGVYAFTTMSAFALSAAVPLTPAEGVAAPLLGRILAALLLAAAAFAGSGQMRTPPSVAASIQLVLGASAACVLAGVALADAFPHVLVNGTGGPVVVLPGLVAVTAVTGALCSLGGVLLWRRAAPLNDTTLRWLGISALLMGCSRLETVLGTASPGVGSLGALVRLAATAAFVAAAAAEFRRFEHHLTDAVGADERRRLARELHDGLAQDLAFVVSQASTLARRSGDHQALREIAYAAERALGDSRRAIHLLKRARSRALSAALAERSYELCSRAGLKMEFAMLGGEVHATPEVEHGVLQIVTEAISNAAKHSGAETVSVELRSTGEKFAVRVTDDGCGFDKSPTRVRRHRFGGFGMTSMAERAHALGGELRVRSDHDGGGTTVEVTLP